MDWKFRYEDLQKLIENLEQKKEKVSKLTKYSLKRKKISTFQKLIECIENLEILMKDEGKLKVFLEDLNSGNYKFSPFKVNFNNDKYFFKLRISLNAQREGKLFHDYIATKLISSKLACFLKEKGFPPKERNVIIQEIIRTLKKQNNLKVLSGDFVSYTQNIPRNKLLEELNLLKLPENIIKLVKSYLDAGNHLSQKVKTYSIDDFFLKVNLNNKFIFDGNFRAIINDSGFIGGTPISNLLSHIFLLRFDEKMKALATDKGFYARYNDDFILLYPNNLNNNYVEQTILEYLSCLYGFNCKDVKDNIVRLGKPFKIARLKNPHNIDFLGYIIRKKREKVFVGVRYKTLKKFIWKYLIDYKLDKNLDEENMHRYIISKAVYLNNWLFSFIHINDKNLIDSLYIQFILPDLYNMIRIYLKENDRKKLKEKVKRIKHFFKPLRIHRQLLEMEKSKGKFIDRIEYIDKQMNEVLKAIKNYC